MKIKDKILKALGLKEEYKSKNVIINDSKLQLRIDNELLKVTLGQWIGALPDSIKSGGFGAYVYTHLPAKDFLKDCVISDEQESFINKRIASLFSMAGYDNEGTCLLNSFDEEKLTFRATFGNGNSLDCEITWGSFLDSCPQLRIQDGNELLKFNFSAAFDKNPDRLSLETYEKRLDNGNTFYRFMSEYKYYGDLYNDQYRLSVEVSYPKSLESKENIYIDEEKMQALISELTLPVDIQKTCKLVSSALLVESEMLPDICITVKKKVNNQNKDEVIDKAQFKNGEFHEFIITRNGKKVVVDKFDNWSIKDENHSVSGYSDVEVGFVVNKVPKNQLALYTNPVTIVDNAVAEYEDAKGIALSLFKKEK